MKYRYFLLLLGVLLIAYLLTGVKPIRPGERAVVRRFGRVVDQPGPGLWIGLPWGMDRVDRVPADLVQTVTVGYDPQVEEDYEVTPPGQLLTGDHNLINVQAVIEYALDNVEDYLVQTDLNTDRADALVRRAGEAALAEWVAGHTVDEALSSGKAALAVWLPVRTQEHLTPYRLGARVLAANVTITPPARVKDDFDRVASAQTGIQTRENEARQLAVDKLRKTDSERLRIERRTASDINRELEMAQKEAPAFEKRLRQYRELRAGNPDILAATWWDEMGRLFEKLSKNGRIDILDNHLGPDGLDITQFAPQPKK